MTVYYTYMEIVTLVYVCVFVSLLCMFVYACMYVSFCKERRKEKSVNLVTGKEIVMMIFSDNILYFLYSQWKV